MTWVYLTLLSAFFLGIYDIFKKLAVNGNAVAPVLLLNCFCGSLVWLPLVILSATQPQFNDGLLFVDSISLRSHACLFLKSALVGASWTCAFFALKRLPISIASPIRSTSPIWTILIAFTLMGERPSSLQWLGIMIILASFFGITIAGKLEGIRIRDRGIGLMVIATFLASLSAIYDKVLMQNLGFRPATVQAWFSIYLVPVMVPLALFWFVRQRKESPFQWRATIPLIAISLTVADFLYFSALAHDDAKISIISPMRRTAVVISLLAGGRLFKEENLTAKAVCVATMLLGVWLVSR